MRFSEVIDGLELVQFLLCPLITDRLEKIDDGEGWTPAEKPALTVKADAYSLSGYFTRILTAAQVR